MHMNRCSISLDIRKFKLKLQLYITTYLLEWLKQKVAAKTNAGEKQHYSLGGNVKWYSYSGKQILQYNSTVVLLSISPREMKIYVY